MSALLKFISTQMPVNNPGSLSAEQYTQVLAFILASNHYPAAEAASGTPSLNEVSLLPYPDGAWRRRQIPIWKYKTSAVRSGSLSALCPTNRLSTSVTGCCTRLSLTLPTGYSVVGTTAISVNLIGPNVSIVRTLACCHAARRHAVADNDHRHSHNQRNQRNRNESRSALQPYEKDTTRTAQVR
jgi:hypothetical protein